MDSELISAEEYDNLSEDDEQCFVEFEAICRRNMNKMLESEHSREYSIMVHQQYMSAVYSVAQECRIPNIPSPDTDEDRHFDSFNCFLLAAQGEVGDYLVDKPSHNP